MRVIHKKISLRAVNNLLTVVVIALAAYLIYMPVAPSATWWLQHEAPVISRQPAPVKIETPPNENTLVMPSLDLQQIIHEGASPKTLHKGVWHRPNTGSPKDGGNFVLAGHRFTYQDPAVFYHLDKVTVGDEIIVFWDKQKYTYRVSDIKTVKPTAVEVEAPTAQSQLTIYTCTPVWSSKYRLVITASLEKTP